MPSTHTQNERTVRVRTWALGFLVLMAVLRFGPVSFSWAMFTNTTQNTASVGSSPDWEAPTVMIVDPGEAIRGTVTVSAIATDSATGVKNVAIAWAPSGTTNFTTLCTDTSSPYSCSFNTVGLPEDYVDIRAIATDNANYTMTDLKEGVLVDNVAPTGSLGTIPNPITGVVTISATASDAGSGVANVMIQRALANTTTFTTICTDVDSPYSCRFDSTQVSDGSYDFRAVVADVAGNTFTTNSVRRIVSNVSSSTSVDPPAAFLSGSVTITANGNAGVTGVNNIRIQRQLAGSGSWVDICTDTSSPYACLWDTTTAANGSYTFRSVMTDNLGLQTTSATVGPSVVDNTPVKGHDVQTTNSGIVGKLTVGDTLSLTYTRSMKLTSLVAGWDGSARSVGVRIRDGGSLGLAATDDTVDVFTTTGFTTAVNLGSVNLKGDFIKKNQTSGFAATMTATTVTVNGQPATQISITLTAISANGGGLKTVTTGRTMVWTPSATAQDLNNIACSVVPVSELGTLDTDF